MKDIGYFGLDFDVEVPSLSREQAAKFILMMCEKVLGKQKDRHIDLPDFFTDQKKFNQVLQEPDAAVKWASQYLS